MRRFGLHSGSSLGITTRQKADGHMLVKQDPRCSSNKLYDYGERAFGGGLCTREVLALNLGEQDRYLH